LRRLRLNATRRNQLSCEGGNRRKQKSSTHERSSPSLTRNLINEFQKTAADEKNIYPKPGAALFASAIIMP
jgi:hypothetical protein